MNKRNEEQRDQHKEDPVDARSVGWVFCIECQERVAQSNEVTNGTYCAMRFLIQVEASICVEVTACDA
jgi:hypothetical protein